jgi:hypothetical protein
MRGMNDRVARSRGLQLTLDQLDVVNVKLAQHRLTMDFQHSKELASAEDTFQACQG